MSRRHRLLLCAVPAVSTVLLASDGKTPAAEGSLPAAAETAKEHGMPALFAWGDVNCDGRLDLAAVSGRGTLQLLANTGDGRFEDVTESSGLSRIANAALALWADYDGDGWLDLFVGAREGASLLLHNDQQGGGIFADVAKESGLLCESPVQWAHWLDHDGDGRLDLHVVAAQTNLLFQGKEGGLFEHIELPLSSETLPIPPFVESPPSTDDKGDRDEGQAGGAGSDRTDNDDGRAPGRQGAAVAPPIITVPTGGPQEPVLICASEIKDQAMPSSCMQASSIPTLGLLYPISANLFVAVGGNVGIGTTTPSARLDVAGTARITNTLTLNPGIDQALDVSTGSIYKGGALFIHTKGGSSNTAIGFDALPAVTTGYRNTASGYRALSSNTTGNTNTASGYAALRDNTTASSNTANGAFALSFNTNGANNTALGVLALLSNTSGDSNTATGSRALLLNTTGDENTASGYDALRSNTTGSFNTASGVSALLSNTTGDRNTATGNEALRNNTTGARNTASGYQALRSNINGNSNTASGYRTLFSNTTGYINTASGSRALYSNTTGAHNTANGGYALRFNTTGGRNTASGSLSLSSNTTGNNNTASGFRALYSNTTGFENTASGVDALRVNDTGDENTACGVRALDSNTSGIGNTAVGITALHNVTTGFRNTGLGFNAGVNLTTGSDNIVINNTGVAGEGGTIRIGNSASQTRAFISGIRGVTTGNANAIAVLIDSAGQLGTVSSSRRFKKDIADMGDATERLLELRPVVFRYKQEQTLPSGVVPLEYGLIAEEVAEIFPDLVVYDEEGEPFTVKYHFLSSMLLNELKKQHERFDAESHAHARDLEFLRRQLESQNEAHASVLDELRKRVAFIESHSFSTTPSAAIPLDSHESVSIQYGRTNQP